MICVVTSAKREVTVCTVVDQDQSTHFTFIEVEPLASEIGQKPELVHFSSSRRLGNEDEVETGKRKHARVI